MLFWHWYLETNIYLGQPCLFILLCFSSWTSGNNQQVHFLVGKWWLDLSVSSLTKRSFGFWFLPRTTLLFSSCMIAFSLFSLSGWFFNRPAVKQHSNVLICNLFPRKSSPKDGKHLMICDQWLGDGHPSSEKENCFIIECRILHPASAFTKSVIYKLYSVTAFLGM